MTDLQRKAAEDLRDKFISERTALGCQPTTLEVFDGIHRILFNLLGPQSRAQLIHELQEVHSLCESMSTSESSAASSIVSKDNSSDATKSSESL